MVARMQDSPRESFRRFLRFAGRYAIAALMIPVGVLLGIGGLFQFACRRARRPKAQV
jgi:hypothetical protein